MSTLTLQPRVGRRACRPAQAPRRPHATGGRHARFPHARAAAFDGEPPLTMTLLTPTPRRVPCMCWPKSLRPHF